MISVFVSRPTWVAPPFKAGLDGFLRVLTTIDLKPRTLGSTDFPSKSPMQEVIELMEQCSGAIILGYPQIAVNDGHLKGQPIAPSPLLLPTEWNHIEAGLACARGLPLLLIHHHGVSRGVFDRGALAGFLHAQDFADPGWPVREEVQGALVKWKMDVVRQTPAMVLSKPSATVADVTPEPERLEVNADDSPVLTRSQTFVSYCRHCGAVPGVQTKCQGPFSTHEFVPWVQGLYCRYCGAVPGTPTKCGGPFSSHSFVSG